MAGEIADLANEAPLLQDDYSQSRPRKGKASSKKRPKQGDKKRSGKKSRVAKTRRSPIADAMGARY